MWSIIEGGKKNWTEPLKKIKEKLHTIIDNNNNLKEEKRKGNNRYIIE